VKRRISISCLFLSTALGILAPTGAQAATAAAVPLTSGQPVKVTISRAGQTVKYTFAATAGKHVTFQVTKFNFADGTNPGSLYLNFYKPGSSTVFASHYFGSNGWYDFTPPLTGTWSVKVAPNGGTTGSMVLTFANDVATKKLASATPVTTRIKFQGQQAGYTFAATANKHVTFQVTQFNFAAGTSSGSFYLNFYEPGNASSYSSHYFGGDGWYDFTPPLTGTWKVRLAPNSGSTGSMTLTFANDVATQALTRGTPVATTIQFEGQHAGYTFTAKAGGTRTFDVTKFNFTDGTNPGSFYLDFYEPGNSSVYTSCYVGGNSSCPVTTPLSGTWTAQLVPNGASVGSMTLTLT
jgi:hypothetical protein